MNSSELARQLTEEMKSVERMMSGRKSVVGTTQTQTEEDESDNTTATARFIPAVSSSFLEQSRFRAFRSLPKADTALSPVQESEDYANESKAEDTNFESKEGHLI
jgi:hypothetical protein